MPVLTGAFTTSPILTDEAQNGRVTISWQILEQNDGGIIQLIYTGNPEVNIRVDGVIEGQKEIEQIVYGEKLTSPDEQFRKATSQTLFMVFFLSWQFFS